MAYYASISNPFLKMDAASDAVSEHSPTLRVGGAKWKGFRRRVDEIANLVGTATPASNA
jgi:trafficking protein particle complex subunit 2